MENLPDDMPDELRKLIEGTQAIEGVEVAAGDAATVLNALMALVTPVEIVRALVSSMASEALRHSLTRVCECGAEGHYDQVFEVLDELVETAKETLRPVYLQTYEREQFVIEATNGLDEIEVL